jgi:hypothetical protein
MDIQNQDTLWAFFDAFAVVLHVDWGQSSEWT